MKVVLRDDPTFPIKIKLNAGDLYFSEERARELRDALTRFLNKIEAKRKEQGK